MFGLACVAGAERGGGRGLGQKGGSKGGAVERALASHHCGQSSNPGVDAICGLSLLLVFSFLLREVLLRVFRFSPLLQSQHFQIPIRPEIRWTKNHYVDVLPANRYLFIYLFIYLGGGRKARKRGKGKGAPYQLSSIPLPFFHSSLSPTFFEACYAG